MAISTDMLNRVATQHTTFIQPDLFDPAHNVVYNTIPLDALSKATVTTVIDRDGRRTAVLHDPRYPQEGQEITHYLNELVQSGARGLSMNQCGVAAWTVECELDVPGDFPSFAVAGAASPYPVFKGQITMGSLLEAVRELNQVVQLYIAAMSIRQR